MKRIVCLALAVSLTALLALVAIGCNGVVDEVIVTEGDSGEKMTLETGQLLVVQLKSNPSTGYGWEVADQPSALEQQGEGTYEQDPGTEGIVGAGGTESFHFLAVVAGDGELILHYLRPWEDPAVIAEEFVLEVVVR